MWSSGVTGAPLLTECAAWVEGAVLNRMSVGDHEAFLIDVGRGGAGHHSGTLMVHEVGDLEPGHPA